MKAIVGGGPKKVLYTLNTVKRIGLLSSAKALKSNNTCKACGLGMGGQHGGMTNEAGEFPSVCNKSIQAQSTDIQSPIPEEIFEHTIDEFQQLSAKEIESLGRLNTPILKLKGQNKFKPISWEQALEKAATQLSDCSPEKSFFYTSGRSSNEAGFILQLLARLYGTNNVTNCSYYCHQATGVGLSNTIGSGTATVELDDLSGCDTVFVIGANPSSNHPRFIHQLKKCRDRGGDVIIINPAKEPGLVKFAVPKSPSSMLKGGDWIASHYLQPKIGSDIFLLNGIAKYIIEQKKTDQHYIEQYTEQFSDFEDVINAISWETISTETGISQSDIEKVARVYADSNKSVFAWGMGITHQKTGVENVETISNLALLRGMIGKPNAGLLPLRGHSNVQGIGTIGVKPVLSEAVFDSIEKHFDISLPKTQGMDTLASLEAAHAGKIHSALIMGGNLFEATPNSAWAAEALDNIGFKLFLTTTLNKGHINGVDNSECLILPVTARDEEWQSTTQESMFNYVRLSDGGITRLDNVKPESHILCEIGKRLLPDNPIDFEKFKDHDTVRSAIAKTIPGMEELKDISIAKEEFHIKNRLIHTPIFQTENQKAKFIKVSINSQIPTNSKNKEHPFTLMSIRSEGQFNSIIYEESDSYRGTKERWSVLLNPQDMKELNINEGDYVDIKSETGEMKRVKTYSFDVAQGNVMAYYPEANVLIGLERDQRSKTPAFKNVAVSISHSTE